jgi:hypothetical protein
MISIIYKSGVFTTKNAKIKKKSTVKFLKQTKNEKEK